ncbi:hypothetical protein V6N11_039333 [Hibiscus sabdariffa]|uniref:Uncharacterized protein n=1 Tax=Hibiscus sabdariffa TaxID=183260 RepID=A0ABR2SN53_9ROSI
MTNFFNPMFGMLSERQTQLRDALNEALREQVQGLKIQVGQMSTINENPFNSILTQFLAHQATPHHFGAQQTLLQQQQLQKRKKKHLVDIANHASRISTRRL